MEHTHLEPARNRIDALTNAVLAFLNLQAAIKAEGDDRRTRGYCQDPNCYETAHVSDTKTSLSYCFDHWYERIGRANYRTIRNAERGI